MMARRFLSITLLFPNGTGERDKPNEKPPGNTKKSGHLAAFFVWFSRPSGVTFTLNKREIELGLVDRLVGG